MGSRTVVVTARLRSSPSALFRTLMDPDEASRVPGVRRVEIVTEGPDGPASVGTLRRTSLPGGVYVVEEIIDIDPPRRFDYVIRRSRPRVRHQLGRMEFREVVGGTEATWSATYSLGVPLADGISGILVRLAFRRALLALDQIASDGLD